MAFRLCVKVRKLFFDVAIPYLQVEPMYFIVAIFMSAPCALALAKLSYPETEKSKFDDVFEMELEPS